MRFLFLLLVLTACAKGQGLPMIHYAQPDARYTDFEVCHGFGCSYRSAAGLSAAQWTQVAALFGAAGDAAAERAQIAAAVAKMEVFATKSADLEPDRGQAETFEKDQHQMDCIDEAVNTHHYLTFLENAGLLRYHSVYEPVHRGYFIDGQWPHNSAAVRETKSGAIWVVDSYYFDSGAEPAVVALDTWLDEWRPEGVN